MTGDPRRTRGLVPGVAALVAGGATAATIVVPAEHLRATASLVAGGLLMLGFSIGTRSERVAALAVVPVLSAAVVHIRLADESVALWALGVGCGWYLATELAWESISRQVDCRFEPAVTRRRAEEIVSVVAIALVAATTALAASSLAPRRTVLLEAVLIVLVLAGGSSAVRRLTSD